MPGRLSTVVRGRFSEGTDQGLRSPTEAQLQAFEQTQLADLTALGKQTGTVPPGDENHSDKEFLGDAAPDAFFPPDTAIPKSDEKRAILLSAYIQALRVALYVNPDAPPHQRTRRAKALPIVSYWISGGPHYEMYVALSKSGNEVHVLIMTPTPHHPPPPRPQGRDEDIWAIASDARIQELHQAIPPAYGPRQPFLIKGAQCQKLKSY